MALPRTSLDALARRINAEGMDAYRLGLGLPDNPYFGTRNAIYWAEGWKDEEARHVQEHNGDPDDDETPQG